jgi:hypothetical protein
MGVCLGIWVLRFLELMLCRGSWSRIGKVGKVEKVVWHLRIRIRCIRQGISGFPEYLFSVGPWFGNHKHGGLSSF